MGIFGRSGCNDKDWRVRIYFIDEYHDDNYRTVGEQLSKKEAEKLYEELKKEFEDKKSYIEVIFRGDTFLIPKSAIKYIEMWNEL